MKRSVAASDAVNSTYPSPDAICCCASASASPHPPHPPVFCTVFPLAVTLTSAAHDAASAEPEVGGVGVVGGVGGGVVGGGVVGGGGVGGGVGGGAGGGGGVGVGL